MAIDSKALGKQIRAARIRKGYTQEEFAFTANLNKHYLERIELGERTPALGMLIRIADQLEAGLDVLMEESREQKGYGTLRELEEILLNSTEEERAFLLRLVVFVKTELRKVK